MLLQSLTLTLLVVASIQAHGPPGVPPRHGQQPPQQQQQQQHQQQQQQQQQPPANQQAQGQGQQFQQQQMNVPEGKGHGHGSHGGMGNKMRFQSEIHNVDHIIEHLQNVIKTKPKDQMSEEELEFHYFKMHDYDNNNKLDGVEIGKALTHFHDDEPAAAGEQETKPPPKVFTDEEIANIVDTVIGDNDEDSDGYVEYFEFKRKQQEQRNQFDQNDAQKENTQDSH